MPTKLTLTDRVVSWFDPVAAIKRAHARTVLSYYEAAKPDRTRKMRRSVGTANHEVLQAGAALRQTARHLEQNYDLALGVLNTLVANVVGANGIGIEPQPRRTAINGMIEARQVCRNKITTSTTSTTASSSVCTTARIESRTKTVGS